MTEQNPPIEPAEHGMLDVGDGQRIYWETVGDRGGLPALFVHGGPGSGGSPDQRRFFDPRRYRGSSLALAYAQRFPERVAAIVLGAVTTGTRREIDWICREMGRVFPREWERLVALVPEVASAGSIPAAYARLLADPDPRVRAGAAQAWRDWEDMHVSLVPGHAAGGGRDPERVLTFARLVTHYWSHDCFLDESEIAHNTHRLAGIPAVLVHGRYDVSSPLETAWRMHRAWPESRLVVVDDAGHGGGSFGSALMDALQGFKHLPQR